jgi:plastocyanin
MMAPSNQPPRAPINVCVAPFQAGARKSGFWLAVALLLAASGPRLAAETVTLPVAASVVGGAPFFSDVRVFNTSYTDVLSVTATYRCTPGSSAACASQPVRNFNLAPREARAFDDICVSLFGVANSLGAVEFASSSIGLLVTSRLYSPASVPPWPSGTVGSVGMFIPGLPSSAAGAVTVLTNLSNAGSATGSFRTNVGVYNPNSSPVVATIRLYDWPGSFPPVLLGVVPVNLGAQTGTQISNIYKMVGFETLVTTKGYATVESDNAANPLFTYAASADNTTQDPVLIVGAADVPAPPGFNPPTATPTPTPSASTPTPTPTPTQPAGATRIVDIQNFSFRDVQEGGSTSHIHVGDTVQWNWINGFHSTTSGPCPPCTQNGDGNWDSGAGSGPSFSHTFNSAGTFPYHCKIHLAVMTGTIMVSP